MKLTFQSTLLLAALFNISSVHAHVQRKLTVCPANSVASATGAACCPAACGTCGGAGCHLRPGGAASCCTSNITESCAVRGPPCLASGGQNEPPAQPPAVPGNQPQGAACPANTVANNEKTVCCPATCGTCGGAGCNLRPGGADSCCSSRATDTCDKKAPPCKPVAGATEPVKPPKPGKACPAKTIANADNTACCPETCGICGGAGCNLRPGGADSCCTSRATDTCDKKAPPCIPTENNTTKPEEKPVPATQKPETPKTPDGYPVCNQNYPPPGVKDGSCMEVTCMPKSVAPGQIFHSTITWCLQRPRPFYATINLLDMNSKEYFTGTGLKVSEPYQCGETTFQLKFDAKPTPGKNYYDVMWKWFITPVWGPDGDLRNDRFPNMLAETGIAGQPQYGQLVDDCEPVPTRFWNLPGTGEQDGIYFPKHPACITPGQPWEIDVSTHLESRDVADLHVNMMLGTGGDLYLGPNDTYVTESNYSDIKKNGANNYYTTQTLKFTAAQTALLAPGDRVYVSAFMTPIDQVWGSDPKTGFTFLDTEYYLNLKLC